LLNFKTRDVTLALLSGQVQNFNFCNFFFKTSETSFFSAQPENFICLTRIKKLQFIYFCRFVNSNF